ncbi:MAG: nucleotidyltransferase family protein [Chloroflexi bacterium]|nr:nucleotidyltransferase family protein [Chloroflexota bacterium]
MQPQIDNHTLSLISTGRLEGLDWKSFSTAYWDLLIAKAHAEGVAPLVYWTLSKSGKFSSLPESARNSLRAMYSATWMHNQRIFKELETLSHLFHQADIPVVVLKGACFALTIYPDIGLRPMGDLDILVPKAKLVDAVQIAKTLGYEDALPEATPGLRDLLNHEICLQKMGEHSITLEIHHSLVADKSFVYSVPVDWFWTQTELLEPSSRKKIENLCMLTPTAQVLYAASHAMLQHGGKNTPLRWFHDLDLLIRVYGERIDWDLLLRQAKIFEWGSALDAALSQSNEYFNTPIPEDVRINLWKNSDRHQQLIALLRNKPATHILEEQQKLLTLNWYGRFRLMLALIVPAPAYMRWRYQLKTSWVLPAYYLIRWWGILKDAFRTLYLLVRKLSATRP